MNYIKQLQAENAALKETIQTAQNEINFFLSYLHSDKFAGVDSAGGRKDWISTSDVINRMREMRMSVILS